MKVIRKGVFETNSSSSHSLVVSEQGGFEPFNIPTNSKGQVACLFGEYGWGGPTLYSQRDKLTYLTTYVASAECPRYLSNNDDPVKEFRRTKGYKLIDKFLQKYSNGFNLQALKKELKLIKGEDGYSVEFPGYIDHQSIAFNPKDKRNRFNGDLAFWLDERNETVESVILNSRISIEISNDNI